MKDVILVGALCIAAIAVGVALYVYGPSLLSAQKDNVVPHTSIAHGTFAVDVRTEKNYRITSVEELNALWRLVHGQEQPRLPSVNFETQEVLAVFDGSHSSGGYAIKVAKVVDTDIARTVHIEQREPGSDCSVASVSTSPYEIVVLPKMKGGQSLTHVDTVVTVPCS